MRLFSLASVAVAALSIVSSAEAADPFERKPWVRNTIYFDPDTVIGAVARRRQVADGIAAADLACNALALSLA